VSSSTPAAGRWGRRMLRYSLVSLVSIAVSQAVLMAAFGRLHWTARLSNVVACAVATVPSYYLNRCWAWGRRGRSHLWKEVVPFWVLAFLGLAFSTWAADLGSTLARQAAASHAATTAVVAASPKRSLAASTGSAICFGLAVLTKETTAVLSAVLLLPLWQLTSPETRRYRLPLFLTVLVGLTFSYPLYALLENELLEGPDHVSLVWAVRWQLFDRLPTEVGSTRQATATGSCGPGLTRIRGCWLSTAPRRSGQLVAVGVVAASLMVGPQWQGNPHRAMTEDQSQPPKPAVAYVTSHIPRGSTLLVDDNLWTDLVRHGFDPSPARTHPSILRDLPLVAAATSTRRWWPATETARSPSEGSSRTHPISRGTDPAGGRARP
jgi:putative flippase GtrA